MNIDADSVARAIHEQSAKGQSRPATLKTDCFFWPHLSAAGSAMQAALADVLPKTPALALADAILTALARRLDESGRQVLLLEASLFAQCEEAVELGSVVGLVEAGRLDGRVIADVLEPYPELARLLTIQTVDLCRFALGVATKLRSEWADVSKRLGGLPSLDKVSRVEMASSDPHAHGCGVVAFGVAGAEFLVALKPRNTKVEEILTQAWQALVQKRFPDWRLPRYLSRTDHGWVEWFSQEPCRSSDEVEQYYLRAGHLLALSVAFGVTDLHRDNIIAHGASPIPVDLEACFHHRKRPGSPSRAGRILPRVMEWNALGTGLLPLWIWKGEDLNGVDLSGLGSLEEQWCSLPLQQFVSRNTPAERLVRSGVKLLPGRNVVRLGEATQYPWHYIDSIVRGYTEALADLRASSDTFHSTVTATRTCDIRFLGRPTAGYYYATQASLHPYYLQSTRDREVFLHAALSDGSAIAPVIVDVEVQACLDGDVPRFVSREGLKIVEPGYSTEQDIALDPKEFLDGHDAVVAEAPLLDSNEYLVFAERLVHGSLTALRTAHQQPADLSTITVDEYSQDVTPESANRALGSSLDFLLRFLNESGGPAGDFYGFRSAPGGQYEFGLIGGDLYSGSSGLLFALHQAMTHNKLASAVVSRWLEEIGAYTIRSLSGYRDKLGGACCGALSAVLPVYCVAQSMGEAALAKSLLEALETRVVRSDLASDDLEFWGSDYLGGRSGALAVLASVYRLTQRSTLLEPIQALVEQLAKESEADGSGVIWRQPAISQAAHGGLTGLSHGQTGFALGLAEAASLGHGNGDLASELAEKAIAWELDAFDVAEVNWPDHRHRSFRPVQGEFAWSHGAPGIYLGLSRIARCVTMPRIERFLAEHPYSECVVRAISTRPTAINHSLCHGALGNVLLSHRLLPAASEELLDGLHKWARLAFWAEYDARPLRQRALDAPGLYVGRAGSLIGWLALTGQTPCVPWLPSDFEDLGKRV